MNTLKVLLNILIALAITAIAYLYYDFKTSGLDLFGKGKSLSCICLISLSLTLLRLSLQNTKKVNPINLAASLILISMSIYLIQNAYFLITLWNYIFLLLLTQSVFALWLILEINKFTTVQKTLYLAGPFLIGVCLITDWFPCYFKIIVATSLVITTIISFVSLFRTHTN